MKFWKHTELWLAALVAGWTLALFHFPPGYQPQVSDQVSVLSWIAFQWSHSSGDFSHGWLMPIVCLIMIWHRRLDLIRAPKGRKLIGLILLVVCLIAHWAAARAQQPRLSLVALVGVLWAIPLFVYGRKVAAIILFPCAYLLLCFTSYVLVSVTFPLRMLATIISTGLLNGLGIAAVRQGTAIASAAGEGFRFDVADACSGLRSLVVMTALAAPYAYYTQKSLLKKWLLFLSAVPLAVAANAIRVATIAIVAETIGHDLAIKIYHDFSGYLVFFIATVLLTTTGTLLARFPRRRGAEDPPQASQEEAPGDVPSPLTLSTPSPARQASYLMVIAVLITAWLLTAISNRNPPSVRHAGKVRLPDRVGDYTGTQPFFCQDEQCAASLTREELAGSNACTRCGGRLDLWSPAERLLLPAATRLSKMWYTAPGKPPFYVTVVFSTQDRRSLHRPEKCSVAQGLSIVSERVIEVPLPEGQPLETMILDQTRTTRLPDGSLRRRYAYLAYWFFSDGVETPHRRSRIIRTALDGVLRYTRRGWAYVSVSGARDGRTELHEARLKDFLRDLHPLLIGDEGGGDGPR